MQDSGSRVAVISSVIQIIAKVIPFFRNLCIVTKVVACEIRDVSAVLLPIDFHQ